MGRGRIAGTFRSGDENTFGLVIVYAPGPIAVPSDVGDPGVIHA
jgi:hypothetical protein